MLGLGVFIFIPEPISFVIDYGQYFLLGLAGAVAANSTGAGGGIVFIPAFTSLGIEGINAVGTSLAIQCFGMTAGSVSWLISVYKHQHGGKEAVTLTNNLLIIAGLPAVFGMLSAQYLFPAPALDIETIFKYFSILFGLVLLLVTLKRTKLRHTNYSIRRRYIPLIGIVSFFGGMVTCWISIGVGEWLAILLFFLGYPTMIVVAVCISSLVVLTGVPYHIYVTNSISWQILVFAAPAAIIGGYFARFLAERLGPIRLKVFFSAWILATGLTM